MCFSKRKIIKYMGWFLLCIMLMVYTSKNVQAIDYFEKQKQALDIIADFADRICDKIPIEGRRNLIELSGEAQADLNKFIKNFLDIGIEGAGKYQNEEYKGVLQKELVSAIKYSTDCKLEIFRKLQDKLLMPSHTTEPPPQKPGFKEIARDGTFIAYSNGIVSDTKTELEWIAGPNEPTTWYEAKSWVESLTIDGGGWRMPSSVELETLYKKGLGTHNMTPLLKTVGWLVWTGERGFVSRATVFDFEDGFSPLSKLDQSVNRRAFAVRSRKK